MRFQIPIQTEILWVIIDRVEAGNYKIRLLANSIVVSETPSITSPSANVDTGNLAIEDVPTTLDGKKEWTLTLILPDEREGSLQISVDEDEFHLTSDMSVEGPATKQYLGTVYYNTGEVVVPPSDRPYIADTPDWDGVFRTPTTDVKVNFNERVRRIDASQFEFDPDSVNLIDDSSIWYPTMESDRDADTRPDDTDMARWTQAGNNPGDRPALHAIYSKYFRFVITVPDPVPPGVISMKIKDDSCITNDSP